MSRTIYGSVDWSTGVAKFGDPGCGDRIDCIGEDIVGCIEWAGEHAGQVKVTIAAAYQTCNDTYYGCVDWGTGKFQISIPDDCCCDCSCWAEVGCEPATYSVTISGVRSCNDDSLVWWINDNFTLDLWATSHSPISAATAIVES